MGILEMGNTVSEIICSVIQKLVNSSQQFFKINKKDISLQNPKVQQISCRINMK